MTPDKTPTDAEIAALYADETGFALGDSPAALLDFARTVLAKWGSPVVAGEPVLYDPQAVLEVFHNARAGSDKPSGYLRGILSVIAHWEGRPDRGFLLTTPQPTQAQAGAVPLPIEIWEVGQQSLQLMFNDHEEAHQYRLRLQGIKEGGQHAAD